MHIQLSTNPCSSKCIQWATLLPLFGGKVVTLVGTFQFEAISVSNRVKQQVYMDQWKEWIEAYKLHGILPLTMGTENSHKFSKVENEASKGSKRKS